MKIINYILQTLFYCISALVPKKKNRIIFGSWFGESYNDNSKYLAEYLSQHRKDLEIYWSGQDHLRAELADRKIKFVKRNSLKSFLYASTSKYAFVTQSYEDICKYNVFNKAVIIQLWHGIPFKLIGDDYPGSQKRFKKLKIYDNYNYFVASSKEHKEKLITAFNSYGANERNILEIGSPRNDFLVKNRENLSLKNTIKVQNGIDKTKLVVTYMPTFRDNNSNKDLYGIINSNNDFIQWVKKNNILFVEKKHYVNKNEETNYNENYFVGLSGIDTQELLLISDILITDYSSCYFDFMLLRRPIIHFAYDYDHYKKNDRGTYYDLKEVSGGEIVYTDQQLLLCIQRSLYERFSIDNHGVIERFLINEKGICCEEIEKLIT